ncbi:hypothetical protein GCM10025857_10290 [Alicyclobacillus contaminans]|uniref:hypothetical protein n=1 Tax=Alicyclobacillus contaminans TaxID=392016 RepID=UPI0004200C57|nr:hypothetical protein [Alicyclobacillus contaminans]GMA49672.1 hypothetical protein GCM10025857_10290 [Alicyclobacillus contaminans]
MDTFPALLVALLCACFAVHVGARYLRNRALSHAFWAGSLGIAATASLAYCIALWLVPHSSWWFKLYYLFGALWMPAVMGLGSLTLVWRRSVVLWVATAVAVVGFIGSVLLVVSPLSIGALQTLHGGAGTG